MSLRRNSRRRGPLASTSTPSAMAARAANARRTHHAAASGTRNSPTNRRSCASVLDCSVASPSSTAAIIHSRPPRASARSAPAVTRAARGSTDTSTGIAATSNAGDDSPASASPQRRSAASATSKARNAAAARPTQSPQATISVRGGARTGRSPITSVRSPMRVPAMTLPVASITAL